MTKTIFANYLILYLRKSLNVKDIWRLIWWNDRFFKTWNFFKKFAFESRCEKIIKTIETNKNIASFCMMNKCFFLQIFEHACDIHLVINTNTQKNMKNRFRIFVRNLITKHESWYLRINDIINYLKIFEIRKFRNRLNETKKLFRVLNFWLKFSMWIKLFVF